MLNVLGGSATLTPVTSNLAMVIKLTSIYIWQALQVFVLNKGAFSTPMLGIETSALLAAAGAYVRIPCVVVVSSLTYVKNPLKGIIPVAPASTVTIFPLCRALESLRNLRYCAAFLHKINTANLSSLFVRLIMVLVLSVSVFLLSYSGPARLLIREFGHVLPKAFVLSRVSFSYRSSMQSRTLSYKESPYKVGTAA